MSDKIIELLEAQSGEVLSEVYSNYTKEDIIKIAKIHHIKKYSSLKKDELINYVVSQILDEEIMTNYFLLLKEVEIKALLNVAKGPVTLTDENSGEYEYLLSGGYLALSYDMQIVIPYDVKLAWNTINTSEFQEKRKRMNVVSEYAHALNYLYGVTPLTVVTQIFNRNEKVELTMDELTDAYKIMESYDCEFQLVEDKFVDFNLIENDEYVEFLKQVEGKSYFVPSRDMISNLGNVYNSKITEELYALYELLGQTYDIEESKLVPICGYIEDNIRLGCTMSEVFEMLNSVGISYDSTERMEEMRDVLANLWNNTRMITNLGFTPNELVEINSRIGQKIVPFKKQEQKVYPNDPCPCGSGKKYKQCCKNK